MTIENEHSYRIKNNNLVLEDLDAYLDEYFEEYDNNIV